MNGPVIHIGPLLPNSSGIMRAKCGKKLPFSKFSELGKRRPNGWRECKTCRKYHDAYMIALGWKKVRKAK